MTSGKAAAKRAFVINRTAIIFLIFDFAPENRKECERQPYESAASLAAIIPWRRWSNSSDS